MTMPSSAAMTLPMYSRSWGKDSLCPLRRERGAYDGDHVNDCGEQQEYLQGIVDKEVERLAGTSAGKEPEQVEYNVVSETFEHGYSMST